MPRTPDEAKRREIAEGALKVLREHGIHQTTMSHIASALGMKRPTLYWYFSDLGEIFEYSMQQIRTDEAAFIVERIRGIDHPLDLLEGLIRADAEFFEQRGLEDFLLLLVQFLGAGDAASRARYRRIAVADMEPLRLMLIASVAAGVEGGMIAPCDPETLVDFLFVVLDGAMVHGVLRGADTSSIYDFVHTAVIAPLRLDGV
ncbi:MAG: TetR/AcrR family transcriptional regulator [Deltaproteobacteria bacterium]|nr:TetR/AcrR family transcriptional regulator [Deltaproteobacteria bacterium]MBW2255317.1 TetR/AcrR family transcriptional regulator [Deltaproteobacteria bacterium]